jgi:hypothetical protein
MSPPAYSTLRTLLPIHFHPSPGATPIHATALLDTGCEANLISLALASRLGFTPGPRQTIGRTINSGCVLVLGAMDIRWCIGHNDYHDDRFFVKEFHADFDVLIGSETIRRLDMLRMDRRFVGPIVPLRRTTLPPVDGECLLFLVSRFWLRMLMLAKGMSCGESKSGAGNVSVRRRR